MKIEWVKNKSIPFSAIPAGGCFLDRDDDVCLACENGWTVILATGEMYQPDNSEYEMVVPIAAKVVVSETT